MESMLKHGCPCVRDCPNRAVGCRKDCAPFKEYEAARIIRGKRAAGTKNPYWYFSDRKYDEIAKKLRTERGKRR